MADRQTLLTWAAAARQAKQVSGITLNGIWIETDPESRGILTGAYVLAKDNPNFAIPNWKIADGVYVTLDRDMIISAGDAVTAFVQACFDKNREIDDKIASGEITTRDEIVAAFEELN